jgi:hypothetical protein|tara:strand:+ start:2012 stop:2215 length:204 start_codon:yes stop_codon:yes gene_type:complete
MTLVFALVTYLGIQIKDESYFRSIDDCLYFANRINKNPPKPLPDNKSVKYTALCIPQKVDIGKVQTY